MTSAYIYNGGWGRLNLNQYLCSLNNYFWNFFLPGKQSSSGGGGRCRHRYTRPRRRHENATNTKCPWPSGQGLLNQTSGTCASLWAWDPSPSSITYYNSVHCLLGLPLVNHLQSVSKFLVFVCLLYRPINNHSRVSTTSFLSLIHNLHHCIILVLHPLISSRFLNFLLLSSKVSTKCPKAVPFLALATFCLFELVLLLAVPPWNHSPCVLEGANPPLCEPSSVSPSVNLCFSPVSLSHPLIPSGPILSLMLSQSPARFSAGGGRANNHFHIVPELLFCLHDELLTTMRPTEVCVCAWGQS